MKTKIDKAIADLRKAEEKVLKMIQAEMVKIALNEGIDRMSFFNITTLSCAGEVVENKEIEALENIYLNQVNRTGFTDCWEKDTGWTLGEDHDG